MTITTGTTAALVAEDKVLILPGAHRSGMAGSPTLNRYEGQTATVVAGPDSDGDYYVQMDESGTWHYVLPEFLQKVTEDAPVVSETVEAFVVGQKYEITGDHGGHGFQTGTIVTALKLQDTSREPEKHALATTREDLPVGSDDAAWAYGTTAWVNVADVKLATPAERDGFRVGDRVAAFGGEGILIDVDRKADGGDCTVRWETGGGLAGQTLGASLAYLTKVEVPVSAGEALGAALVDDAALREAREEAERAEKALADFKARVRVDLISESYRQGDAWIRSVDEWLEELGLESQYGPLPTAMGSVVLLTDNRLARLADTDSRPWEVKRITSDGARYLRYFGTQEIIDDFVAVVYEGPDEDDTIQSRRDSDY